MSIFTKKIRISIIGLGKIGSPLATMLACAGFKVIGVDLNADLVDKINAQNPPVDEPGLAEKIKHTDGRLTATTDYKYAIKESDVTFVIVPTPSRKEGDFSNEFVIKAVAEIGAAIRGKDADAYHLVNIISTVMPGSTEGVIRSTLEAESDRELGQYLGLTYNPQFIALGTALSDLLKPDMILIGHTQSKDAQTLKKIYQQMCGDVPFILLNPVNAELAKIAINNYLTMKISFANGLAEACETISHADVCEVTRAMGMDSRISPKYLLAGLGFGGPCFRRDGAAFSYLMNKNNAPSHLAKATKDINAKQIDRLYNMLNVSRDGPVAILGMAYKDGSSVIEHSIGVALAKKLIKESITRQCFDPMISGQISIDCLDITLAENMEQCLKGATAVVLTTKSVAFDKLPNLIANLEKKPRIIIDPWRQFKLGSFNEVEHRYIGMNKDTQEIKASTAHTQISMASKINWMFDSTRENRTKLLVGVAAVAGALAFTKNRLTA